MKFPELRCLVCFWFVYLLSSHFSGLLRKPIFHFSFRQADKEMMQQFLNRCIYYYLFVYIYAYIFNVFKYIFFISNLLNILKRIYLSYLCTTCLLRRICCPPCVQQGGALPDAVGRPLQCLPWAGRADHDVHMRDGGRGDQRQRGGGGRHKNRMWMIPGPAPDIADLGLKWRKMS